MTFSTCDDKTIDPFEAVEGTYSMYGALEIGKTPNYIRIKDLRIPFSQVNPPDFDAIVRFENLSNGITTTLEDTVVNFSGNLTHNFIVEERIESLNKYRISVERSDGVNVQTIATGPHITEVETEPANDVDCEQQIEFTFKNVPVPEQVVLEVGFNHGGQMLWSGIGIVDELERIENTDELYINMSPRNLMVEVFTPSLEGPGGRPIPTRFLYPTVSCFELPSNIVYIRYTHFGPEWEAVEPVWPVNPQHVMDVENGLGFVGALRQDTFSITIDQTLPE